MNAQELYLYLATIPETERAHARVRVCYFGREYPSFNIPATRVSGGPNFGADLTICCEEIR